MKINFVGALALAFSLLFAPLALQALAQNTGGTSTQSGQSTQSSTGGASTQTTRETTTTVQTSRPSQTTTSDSTTGVNPLWLILGGVALVAILLIVALSARGRSRRDADVVYESKTTVKRD